MRILVLHPQMSLYGGAEIVVLRLARYWIGLGWDVSIATLSTADLPQYKGLSFITPEKQIDYGPRSLRDLPLVIRQWTALRKLVSEVDQYDVVNPHNFPAVQACCAARRIVWMCNEIPDLWHSKYRQLLNGPFSAARLIDRLVVRSKKPVAVVADGRMAKIFRKRYGFEPHVIPYGIDSFDGGDSRPNIKEEFRVIYPAIIAPSKNQVAVLKAASRLKDNIHGLKIILSGYHNSHSPYAQCLKDYASLHKLNVEFINQTTREELNKLYHTCHVAVFAGIGQGSWLGPFEQLSAGTPVVVSPNLSCSDLIREAEIGTTTNNLESALSDVHHNYQTYRQQALKGQEFVLRNLTWDRFCEKFTRLLH